MPMFSEMKEYSVFRRYNEGDPSCRLYIKNLAKQVSEEVWLLKKCFVCKGLLFFILTCLGKYYSFCLLLLVILNFESLENRDNRCIVSESTNLSFAFLHKAKVKVISKAVIVDFVVLQLFYC